MKFQLAEFIVFVGVFCFTLIRAQSPCPNYQILCGSKCAHPKTSSETICSTGNLECRFGYRRCGAKCIPVGVDCDVCGFPEKKCGNRCYNPQAGEECTAFTNYICKSGKKACGRVCYSPHFGDTCNKGNSVCKAGQRPCGHNCYSLNLGESCHRDIVVCKSGETICGYRCIRPAAGESCTSSENICRRGQKPCGKFCYDTSIHRCFNGNHICLIGEEVCLGTRCYNPSLGQRCYPKEGLICDHGHFPINGKCRKPRSKWHIFNQLMHVIG